MGQKPGQYEILFDRREPDGKKGLAMRACRQKHRKEEKEHLPRQRLRKIPQSQVREEKVNKGKQSPSLFFFLLKRKGEEREAARMAGPRTERKKKTPRRSGGN